VGNHDYYAEDAPGYFGAAAGDPEEGYYAYDRGNWHVVVLNSMCEEVGGCEATSPILTWLERDLDANSQACTLAYFHHPLFSSGMHGNQPEMRATWDVLYAANANLVVNGHDHECFAS